MYGKFDGKNEDEQVSILRQKIITLDDWANLNIPPPPRKCWCQICKICEAWIGTLSNDEARIQFKKDSAEKRATQLIQGRARSIGVDVDVLAAQVAEVSVFIEDEADSSIWMSIDGETFLHTVCTMGSPLEVVLAVIDRGADIHSKDNVS